MKVSKKDDQIILALSELFSRVFVKDRLKKELRIFTESNLEHNHKICISWIDSIETLIRSRNLKTSTFFRVFSELKINEKILSEICRGENLQNFHLGGLSYLFSLCYFGSEDFFFWFFRNLRKVVQIEKEKYSKYTQSKELENIVGNIIDFLRKPLKTKMESFSLDLFETIDENNHFSAALSKSKIEDANKSIQNFLNLHSKTGIFKQAGTNLLIEEMAETFFRTIHSKITKIKTDATCDAQKNTDLINKYKNTTKREFAKKICEEHIDPLENKIKDFETEEKLKINQREKLMEEIAAIDNRLSCIMKSKKKLAENLDRARKCVGEEIASFHLRGRQLRDKIKESKQIIKSMEIYSTLISGAEKCLKREHGSSRLSITKNDRKEMVFKETLVFLNAVYSLQSDVQNHLTKLKDFDFQITTNYTKEIGFDMGFSDMIANEHCSKIKKAIAVDEKLVQTAREKAVCVCQYLSKLYGQAEVSQALRNLPSNTIDSLNIAAFVARHTTTKPANKKTDLKSRVNGSLMDFDKLDSQLSLEKKEEN